MAQEEFFTWTSFGTVAIASGAVLVATNTVRKLIKLTHPFVPFVFSALVTFGGAYRLDQLAQWDQWAISLFNTCLLFCTATGMQEAGASAVHGTEIDKTKPFSDKPVRWWSSWL